MTQELANEIIRNSTRCTQATLRDTEEKGFDNRKIEFIWSVEKCV